MEHVCGSCTIREKVECTNNKVKEFMMKENKTKQEHSDFAFNLMLRRSMNAILREDFKSVQPGTSPTTEFLRLRFGMSSSYTSKIVLYLVQHGYIVFFGGFKMVVLELRLLNHGIQLFSPLIQKELNVVINTGVEKESVLNE